MSHKSTFVLAVAALVLTGGLAFPLLAASRGSDSSAANGATGCCATNAGCCQPGNACCNPAERPRCCELALPCCGPGSECCVSGVDCCELALPCCVEGAACCVK